MDTATESAQPLGNDAHPTPRSRDRGNEYDVVRIRFESLTFAYVCFALVFVWFRVYWWLIREGWFWAFTGGGIIALFGTVNAYRAWRKTRTFPALVALLLDGGLLTCIVLPMMVFYLIVNKILW